MPGGRGDVYKSGRLPAGRKGRASVSGAGGLGFDPPRGVSRESPGSGGFFRGSPMVEIKFLKRAFPKKK